MKPGTTWTKASEHLPPEGVEVQVWTRPHMEMRPLGATAWRTSYGIWEESLGAVDRPVNVDQWRYLHAPPTEQPERTVRVRVPVLTGPDTPMGDVLGWWARDWDYARRIARDMHEKHPTRHRSPRMPDVPAGFRLSWLTADVPLPDEPATIAAEVE